MYNYIFDILKLVWKLFINPLKNYHTIWLVIPLILILITIHFYFGRYRSEELGWNSAFGNSISLFWICIILWKYLHDKYDITILIHDQYTIKYLFLISFLSVWVIMLLIFNFFHLVSRKLAFIISSADSIYILAYIIISIIMTDFVLNYELLFASIILFILMILLFDGIKILIPMTKNARQVLKNKKKKDKRKKAAKKAAKTRKKNSN